MQNLEGLTEFEPQQTNAYPRYLFEEREFFTNRKLIGFMRCYDCEGEIPLDQADSYMCRKVHQTISRLSNKGWSDIEIIKESKRIYGNDIIYRHYEAQAPVLVFFN